MKDHDPGLALDVTLERVSRAALRPAAEDPIGAAAREVAAATRAVVALVLDAGPEPAVVGAHPAEAASLDPGVVARAGGEGELDSCLSAMGVSHALVAPIPGAIGTAGALLVGWSALPTAEHVGAVRAAAAVLGLALRLVTRELEVERRRLAAATRQAAITAHRLHNLLTPIVGHAALLARHVPPSSPARPDVDDLVRAGGAATAFVDHLAASGERSGAPSIAVHDIHEVAATAAGPALAPDGGERLDAVVDRAGLTRALGALLDNARRAAGPSGRVEVRVQAVDPTATERRRQLLPAPEGACVRVAVSDDGPGMEPAVRERAFEPLFTTRRAEGAAGLGLAAVLAFVQRTGAGLDLVTAPGAGTTVSLFLRAAARREERRVDAPTPAPAARAPSATVLVLEDAAPVRRLVSRCLRRAGYTVVEAGSVAEARALAGPLRELSAVITDVVLPDGDGPALAAELRATRSELAVLYVTGLGARRALDAPTLCKPFTADALLTALHTVLPPTSP